MKLNAFRALPAYVATAALLSAPAAMADPADPPPPPTPATQQAAEGLSKLILGSADPEPPVPTPAVPEVLDPVVPALTEADVAPETPAASSDHAEAPAAPRHALSTRADGSPIGRPTGPLARMAGVATTDSTQGYWR